MAGAGKSAVLNSLIGHPVLVTNGENGAARSPIIIDLSREPSLSGKAIILQIDNKSQQVSARKSPSLNIYNLAVVLCVILFKIRLIKGASGKSRDPIYLNLPTSTSPPLKLVDLPGLDQRIISEYAQHNDAILLITVPASQASEISSSRALKIAKEHDPQRPPKTTDIPGVALIGQSVSIASAQSGTGENSFETAWGAESESLKFIVTGAPQIKLGRISLVNTLASQIRSRMKRRLPNIVSGLQAIYRNLPHPRRRVSNF
ncbi:hypothetical protein Bca52824_007443 [Brassica carinata]|uniref:Dynamin-type G domain-containing protein n=1 Tax=Brassica carinata TaxID=52824 RepID=A0A8X8B716_BRACI|nr:hypothetical protein Bca52824_007443 [Brassica carinata]